jgi:hypothetical protein
MCQKYMWSVISLPKSKKNNGNGKGGTIELAIQKGVKLPLSTNGIVLQMKSIDDPIVTVFCGNTLTVQFEQFEPVKLEAGATVRVPIGADEETKKVVTNTVREVFETITTELDVAMSKRIKTLNMRKKASGSLKNYYLISN